MKVKRISRKTSETRDAGPRELQDSVHGQDVKCNDDTGGFSSPDGSTPVRAVELLRALTPHPETAPEPCWEARQKRFGFRITWRRSGENVLGGRKLDSGSTVTGFTIKPSGVSGS
jgi:hypothetical protein